MAVGAELESMMKNGTEKRSPCNVIIMLLAKSSEQYHNFSPM
jgi:hypothetical protein